MSNLSRKNTNVVKIIEQAYTNEKLKFFFATILKVFKTDAKNHLFS